jgi:large subunit ribosomal protein L10
MPISKDKKKEIFAGLTSIANDAKSVVFVSFHGVNVADTTTMRRALTAQGVKYLVAKKSLIKKALGTDKITGTMPELAGEIAIAYGVDEMAPAREVYAFQKKLDKKLNILGGIFEGAFKTQDEMVAIATIPSRDVLLSKIAFLLKSPIQRLAIAVSEVAKTKN